MRTVLHTFTITVVILLSCNNKEAKENTIPFPEDSKPVTIRLKEKWGEVSCYVPNRFDTSISWTRLSDCNTCNDEMYRFQPKSLPVYKESGFYYTIPDILLDQFTITHPGVALLNKPSDTTKNLISYERFKEEMLSDPSNGKMIHDTIEKIGDRYFSIISMSGFDTKFQKHFIKVVGITTIQGNTIEFHYDRKTTDLIYEKQFIEVSTQFIRTIRIRKG